MRQWWYESELPDYKLLQEPENMVVRDCKIIECRKFGGAIRHWLEIQRLHRAIYVKNGVRLVSKFRRFCALIRAIVKDVRLWLRHKKTLPRDCATGRHVVSPASTACRWRETPLDAVWVYCDRCNNLVEVPVEDVWEWRNYFCFP